METTSGGVWWAPLGIAAMALFVGACAGTGGSRGPYGPDDPETNVKKVALPTAIPKVHQLQFSDPGDGTLSVPRGASPLGVVGSSAREATTLKDTDLVTRALASQQVQAALGERYRLIEVDSIESGKFKRHGCCDHSDSPRRLTFYSYSNSTTIEVVMKGTEVVSVASRAGYQPPETQAEADDAIALVRQDGRLAGKLEGLDGHVIITEPGEGLIWNDPGYGHRVLWVTFSKGREGRPLYWALVDLDTRTVLKAREEPQD